MGMLTRASAARQRSSGSPAPSPPSSTPSAAVKSTSYIDAPPRGTVATMRTPAAAPVSIERRERAAADDRQMKRAAHRGAQRLPSPRIGRQLVEHDAGRAGRGGRSDDRAGVAGILQPGAASTSAGAGVSTDAASPTGVRALATTPVGEFTGDSAFSTVPDTSTTCAPCAPQAIDDGLFVRGGRTADRDLLDVDAGGRRFAEQVPAVEQHQRPPPRASSRNSLTMGCWRLVITSSSRGSGSGILCYTPKFER